MSGDPANCCPHCPDHDHGRSYWWLLLLGLAAIAVYLVANLDVAASIDAVLSLAIGAPVVVAAVGWSAAQVVGELRLRRLYDRPNAAREAARAVPALPAPAPTPALPATRARLAIEGPRPVVEVVPPIVVEVER